MAILLMVQMFGIIFIQTFGSPVQEFSVTHIPSKICTLPQSSLKLPCMYTYPKHQRVTMSGWKYKASKDMLFERQMAYSVTNGSDCSLRLNNVTWNDTGIYQFSFRTNVTTEDQTDENGVMLEITDLKVEMEMESDKGVVEGDWVILICGSCIPSLTVPTYIWHKDGHEYKQMLGNNYLELTRVNRKDGGSYQCSIRGYKGLPSSSVSFTVNYPPKNISVYISPSGDIVEGSSVTLTCSSEAKPPVNKYTWFIGETEVGTGNTYKIIEISSEDSGEYKCSCGNEHGERKSSAVTLNVLYPPKDVSVSISPSSKMVEGGLVSLTCSSDANPSAKNFTWFKVNASSPVGYEQSYSFIFSSSSGGRYYCEAQNSLGSQRSAAVLITGKAGHAVILYALLGVGILGVVVLLSSVFWLRNKRLKKKTDVHVHAKDDTYASLDPTTQSSDNEYQTITVVHHSSAADKDITSCDVYENLSNLSNVSAKNE